MKEVHNEKYMKLGLKIAYYRKLRKLTQEQLAETINKSTAFIGQIEAVNVTKGISVDTLFDIAEALAIPPYKLLDFED
ncbi:MAG: helix-turn-helix transcriptional regulator [Clostridiales bacterium]|jgi:transcriptional regulator with XRE-family HTH domain|nr:helix-turn-helix transcriptional regulator [Clostridiales bacterium]